jgi:hypothetical protein
MRKLRLLSLSSLALAFIFVSCTKEGPEGPVGASGAQGPAGLPGATGPAGPAGPGVTYSAWFLTGAGWEEPDPSDPDDFHGEVFQFNRAAPSVTQAVIDQGIVLAYMKGDPNLVPPASNSAFLLPTTVGPGFGFIDLYDFALTPGNIRFLYKSDFAWAAEDLAVISFRYITVPGTTAGKNAIPTYGGYTAQQLKAMPYEEVAALFSIPSEGTNVQ